MRNLKNFLDKKTGREVYNISVTIHSGFDETRTRLSFTLKIQTAHLNDVFNITFYISNRRVNGETDETEFDYLFNKQSFQRELRNDTYDMFNLQFFGIDPENLKLKFIQT